LHNRNNGKLVISSLKLARGTNSFFRLNVDGVAGKSFTNLEIAAQDSMYIFVEVTIDPSYDPVTSPFIYKDSILFEVNGNQQHFDLIAFGQNAYYHMPNQEIIFSNTQALYYGVDTNVVGTANVTWKNDKPHLIYGYLVVDSLHTLTIPSNTKIYLHQNAGIWVYRYGTIHIGDASSSSTNTVSFQGDRLEQEYKDVPGQWDRIWINEGITNNTINYAVIKNGNIGVHAGYAVFGGYPAVYNTSLHHNLTINNTIIQNCSSVGVLGQAYSIRGGNNVVVNCGQHILEFDYGGNYVFYQSTFANYWAQTNNSSSSSSRTTPSFAFNNYYNEITPSPFDSLYFGNCILDGSMPEEFNFDTLKQSGGFNPPYKFDYCALKTGVSFGTAHTSSCQINQQMNFINTTTYNFDLSPNPPYSAAWGTGGPANGGYATDINGHSPAVSTANPNGLPNIGAYQQ